MSQVSSSSSKSSSPAFRVRRRLGFVGAIPVVVIVMLVAALSLLNATPSRAQLSTYYVTPGGTGLCTIADPCGLHAAVSLAVAGDAVHVAAGTYTRLNVTDNVVITLTESITFSGGFDAANFNNPPDPLAFPTILDGTGVAGGILIQNGASPVVENFFIRNGQAANGAGIYNVDGAPLIRNNHIHDNNASSRGAGVYDLGGATMVNNEIYDNQTGNGGFGAGVAIENNGALSTLRLNQIYSNTAPSGTGGGLLLDANAGALLEANTFHHNNANSGGGLYALAPLSLNSNLFFSNTAQAGGAIGLSSPATLWNNTIADNNATSNGAGIYIFGSTITLTNNIIAFNQGGTNSGVGVFGTGAATGSYNNIYTNTVAGSVNLTLGITGDPGFVNRATGNYRLDNSVSPNVDAGDPLPPAFLTIDIDGRPRIINGRIDVGADEYEPAVPGFNLTPAFLQDSADKPATITYQHLLENVGTAVDTYQFSCANSLNWTVTCPTQVVLNPGENQTVDTMVQVPGTAMPLSQATTFITATSQLSPTLFERAIVQTTVNPSPGLTFTPNYSDTVLPGDVITYTYSLPTLVIRQRRLRSV